MNKLLALNRGEIAIRILRAANELGLRTVAIYSQEDRLALHRFKADEAYLIGEGKGPVEAYLDVDGIVALAQGKGRGRYPSRLRLPGRESGVAARLRKGRHRLHRPQRGIAGTAGRQTRRAATGAKGRHPDCARHGGTGHRSAQGRAHCPEDRISADREGCFRRRRTRHARGAQRGGVRRTPGGGAAGSGGGVRQRCRVPGALHRARAAYRGADSG